MLPYVYKLTHRESGQFYIGYREANIMSAVEDLPKYQTSSKIVKEMGFSNFDWEILAEFEDPVDAYDLEQKLISKHFQNPLCLNGFYLECGKKRFKAPSKWSNATREKMKVAQSGRTISESQKAAIRESNLKRDYSKLSEKLKEHWRTHTKPVDSEETRRRKSESHKGKKMSLDNKEKLRQSKLKSFRLISPNGDVYEGKGLTDFCKQHNIDSGLMSQVCRGLRKQHKGWKGEFLG